MDNHSLSIHQPQVSSLFMFNDSVEGDQSSRAINADILEVEQIYKEIKKEYQNYSILQTQRQYYHNSYHKFKSEIQQYILDKQQHANHHYHTKKALQQANQYLLSRNIK